jgi:CDP-diacylglycerol--serine O-phosphatidyltransferase
MNPANAITLLSAASGLAGILTLVVSHSPVASAVASTCVAASLVFDRLDGAVARRLGLTSPMGARLDSLADLLAFGALPAALITARAPRVAVAVAAILYALGAVWRLARYDEDELTDTPAGQYFKGVPSPAAGAAVVVAVSLDALLRAGGAEVATALAMAALMPSTVRYPKRGVGAWPWMVLVPAGLALQWWRVIVG